MIHLTFYLQVGECFHGPDVLHMLLTGNFRRALVPSHGGSTGRGAQSQGEVEDRNSKTKVAYTQPQKVAEKNLLSFPGGRATFREFRGKIARQQHEYYY